MIVYLVGKYHSWHNTLPFRVRYWEENIHTLGLDQSTCSSPRHNQCILYRYKGQQSCWKSPSRACLAPQVTHFVLLKASEKLRPLADNLMPHSEYNPRNDYYKVCVYTLMSSAVPLAKRALLYKGFSFQYNIRSHQKVHTMIWTIYRYINTAIIYQIERLQSNWE